MTTAKIILGIPLLVLIAIGATAAFIHMGLGAGHAWGMAKLAEMWE